MNPKQLVIAWLSSMFGDLRDKETGAFQMNQIMGVIFSVILVVVGLVMLPLVLDQTQTARSNSYIGNFAGTQAIIDLIPLLYSVGVLGLAGFVALSAIRGGKN